MAKGPQRPSKNERVQAAREKAQKQRQEALRAQKRRSLIIKVIVAIAVVVIAVAAVLIVLAVRNKDDQTPAQGGYPQHGNEYGGVTLVGTNKAEKTNLTKSIKAPEEDPAEPAEDVNISGVNKDGDRAHVQIYADPACPHCAEFEDAYGDLLAQQLDQENITLEYRMVPYMDPSSPTNYSSRANNALACVADSEPKAYLPTIREIFNRQDSGQMNNQELAELAISEGAPKDVESCIKDGTFRPWVAQADQQARKDGVSGTPSVFVNGVQYDGEKEPDFQKWLSEQVQSARD